MTINPLFGSSAREDVDVMCTVSRYNYTEDSISWYKQTKHGIRELSTSRYFNGSALLNFNKKSELRLFTTPLIFS